MIQPRLGVNWDYSDRGSVYINYAKYNPSASSLARAASWDRNLRSRIDMDFDINGDFIDGEGVDSSSGKWFADGLKPRHTKGRIRRFRVLKEVMAVFADFFIPDCVFTSRADSMTTSHAKTRMIEPARD